MRARKHKVQSESHSGGLNMNLFENRLEAAEMDLVKDVNQGFFDTAYEIVRQLSTRDAFAFITSKMKLFVDLLARMHSFYVAEIEAGEEIRGKVQFADEKLALALKTTATSEAVMEHLRESLAEAWRTVDAVHLREARMQGQLVNIPYQLDLRQTHFVDPEVQSKEIRIRAIVYRERDRLAAELLDYQKRLELNREYSQSLESIIATNEEALVKINENIRELENEKHNLERNQLTLRDGYEERILTLQKTINEGEMQLAKLKNVEKDLVQSKIANEKRRHVIDRLTHDNSKLSKSVRRHLDEKKRLTAINKLLETSTDRLNRDNTDLEALNRNYIREAKKRGEEMTSLERRFQLVAKKNNELSSQVMVLQHEALIADKKLVAAHHNVEEIARQREEIKNNREKVRLEVVRLNDIVAGLRHDMALQTNQLQGIQLELSRANKTLNDKEAKLQKLIREKTELLLDSQELHKRIETLEESLMHKTERLVELKASLQQKQQEFMNVKKQLEHVHSEKMMLLKNMDVCTRDRHNLQSISGKLTHQINQLSSELASNEKEMNSLRNQIDQLNSTVKQKENEIHLKERLLHSTRTDVRELKIRLEKSNHIIDEDEKRFKQISHTLEEGNKEKTLVGLQMVRRNDELLSLREKVAMMQFAIDSGTAQYNKRIEDIRLLKLEITNLNMSRDCLKRAVDCTADLRHEIVRLERQLNEERLRVTAYVEEVARPCRIHRWRVLQGKDPRRYELIRKIQLLLKRNIRLNVERTNMEQKLQDSQRMYNTLKQQLQHMPDPGVAQALSDQQRINREQQRRMRALTAELSITEIDLKTRDCIIEGYQQAMQEQYDKQQKQKGKCQCQELQKLREKDWLDVSLDRCTKKVFQSSSSDAVPCEKRSHYIRAKS